MKVLALADAAIAFPYGKAILMETAPGVTVQQFIDATEAALVGPPQVPEMAI
jgi:acetate CoA/acetoacetate CoA-transferase beta subunit